MSNAEAWFNIALRPRKPEGSLGRTAQDGHLDFHTAPELFPRRWGKRETIYLTLHCHHQDVSCIKMGSDESYFNISLIVWDKVTRQRPYAQLLKRKRESCEAGDK